MVTASGLVFIGASMDSRVRAIDIRSGEVLWRSSSRLRRWPCRRSTSYKGKQYVVFVAGGNAILTPKVSDEVVASSLP